MLPEYSELVHCYYFRMSSVAAARYHQQRADEALPVASEAPGREMVGSSRGAISFRKLGMRDEVVAQNERVHMRSQEAVQSLLWTANNGLIVIE